MGREISCPGFRASKSRRFTTPRRATKFASGKFDSPESSAALAANTFGFFLNRPGDLPPLPGFKNVEWPTSSLHIEKEVRFPWRGGRHPWLDALVVNLFDTHRRRGQAV